MTEGKFFWLAGVIVAALILSSCVAQVAPEDWLYLGKRNVNFSHDRDRIVVSHKVGPLRQLMALVRNYPVAVFDVRIFFANGTSFDAVGRQNLFPGGDRLFIDLPGGERTVREVIFRYSKLPGKHKTVTVELYGR